jgi:putative transposase
VNEARACLHHSLGQRPRVHREGKIKGWLAASGVETLYIEPPGAPWENAYSETFISRLRDELVDREMFVNLKEAKILAEDYRHHYNQQRPHGALGYLTPMEEFAATEDLRHQALGASEAG